MQKQIFQYFTEIQYIWFWLCMLFSLYFSFSDCVCIWTRHVSIEKEWFDFCMFKFENTSEWKLLFRVFNEHVYGCRNVYMWIFAVFGLSSDGSFEFYVFRFLKCNKWTDSFSKHTCFAPVGIEFTKLHLHVKSAWYAFIRSTVCFWKSFCKYSHLFGKFCLVFREFLLLPKRWTQWRSVITEEIQTFGIREKNFLNETFLFETYLLLLHWKTQDFLVFLFGNQMPNIAPFVIFYIKLLSKCKILRFPFENLRMWILWENVTERKGMEMFRKKLINVEHGIYNRQECEYRKVYLIVNMHGFGLLRQPKWSNIRIFINFG